MKYSNALNKPWFKIDEDGMITDLASDVYEDESIIDVMNDSTEKAIVSADKITRLEQENKKLKELLREACDLVKILPSGRQIGKSSILRFLREPEVKKILEEK